MEPTSNQTPGVPPRPGRNIGSGVRLGYLGDSADWKLITDLYYWDKVVEAYERSLEAGTIGGGSTLGFYRLVEGEALTRQVSKISDLTPWLKLEEIEGSPDGLAQVTVEVCREVAGRLAWNYDSAAMVSILVPEADVPWHSARYGYMMDKYPYDKVCLPAAALADQRHFRRVLAHEYAHVVTLNRTSNRAPHWLEEGISTWIEGPGRPDAIARFKTGESTWRTPQDLENAFGAERRNGENRDRIRDAYDQARILTDYLARQSGEAGIQRFLGAFSDNSLWDEFKIRLGEPPVEEALKQVYGIGQKELFEAAGSEVRG